MTRLLHKNLRKFPGKLDNGQGTFPASTKVS